MTNFNLSAARQRVLNLRTLLHLHPHRDSTEPLLDALDAAHDEIERLRVVATEHLANEMQLDEAIRTMVLRIAELNEQLQQAKRPRSGVTIRG